MTKRKSSAREYKWATLILGDINTGDLALQIGGVSDKTVIYGYGSWSNLTSD
jgi:hypothetical protein